MQQLIATGKLHTATCGDCVRNDEKEKQKLTIGKKFYKCASCNTLLAETAFPASLQQRAYNNISRRVCTECCMPACRVCKKRPTEPLKHAAGWDENWEYTCPLCRLQKKNLCCM